MAFADRLCRIPHAWARCSGPDRAPRGALSSDIGENLLRYGAPIAEDRLLADPFLDDPAHRDAAPLQGVRIIEDPDGTEAVFDGLDQPEGNRYILVRSRDGRPCPECGLLHNGTLRRGTFNLAANGES